jgi:hypothetical protein
MARIGKWQIWAVGNRYVPVMDALIFVDKFGARNSKLAKHSSNIL